MSNVMLTREELYERVWTTPMMKLAAEFGISDVVLAKTCRRMNIPRPGRGYWARLEAGQKMKRPRLPKARAEDEKHVHLRSVENAEPRPRTPKPPRLDVDVATTLRGADEVVRGLGRLLQHAQVDEGDRLIVSDKSAPALAVSVAAHRRALLVIDALCKVLRVRGHAVALLRPKDTPGAAAKARIVAKVRNCELEIALIEVLDQ